MQALSDDIISLCTLLGISKRRSATIVEITTGIIMSL